MKYLEPVTLVNTPEEIYQLFTEIFPELVPQVNIWFPQGEYTETNRKIEIYMNSGMRLRFEVKRDAGEEEWRCGPVFMIPAYMTGEISDDLFDASPATHVDDTDNLEKMTELFCRMFPEYRYRVIDSSEWLGFGSVFRGIHIQMADREHVLFKLFNRDGEWEATFPLLLPRPDEEVCPPGELEEVANSEIVIIL